MENKNYNELSKSIISIEYHLEYISMVLYATFIIITIYISQNIEVKIIKSILIPFSIALFIFYFICKRNIKTKIKNLENKMQ